jgi:hypothetical protein
MSVSAVAESLSCQAGAVHIAAIPGRYVGFQGDLRLAVRYTYRGYIINQMDIAGHVTPVSA